MKLQKPISQPATTSLDTLAITFDLPLRERDIPAFRGAVAAKAGLQKDLFHNHNNAPGRTDNYQRRYPLIQYRVHNQRAALFGINAGAAELATLFDRDGQIPFRMNGKARPLRIRAWEQVRGLQPRVFPSGQQYRYRIQRFVPFNVQNYKTYKQLPSLIEKAEMLQRLLRNHIVHFAWSIGWQLPDAASHRLTTTLHDIERTRRLWLCRSDAMAFDLTFGVNAELPEGIAIGRKTAFGVGELWPVS